MTDLFLEFNDACMENMGHMNAGRIKFSDQNVVFKNTKSGRMEQVQASDVEICSTTRLNGSPGVRIKTKNGSLYRFGGFTESDIERLKSFVKKNWSKELIQEDLSVRGWNHGEAKFDGNSMEFHVEDQPCFEVPLQNVSNCTAGKNEVAVEFHQNDDCPVSLMEMRFHLPTTDNPNEDPVEEFRRRIMQYAGIIQETGKALAVLDQILCSTPRGRYDIKLYPTFLALHGKTFDYKIPISTILRLFLLPHRDGRRMFFVISLDPPIKQGQTRYHFLICEFLKDEEIDLELGLPEEVIKEKYEGQLQKNMHGPLYEVVSRIMKTLVKKKITVPGNFIGHSGTPAVSCAYKSAAGFMYPLEKGFMYVHKPPLHIRQEEIACVNFARSDVSTRTFDFEIETKNGNSFTFTSIEKDEYVKLMDYAKNKKLRIKNFKSVDAATKENFFEGSDEDEKDHYAEKLKRDAREKEEEEDDEDESEDEDYNPENDKGKGSEPEEEFDSDASESSAASDESSPKKKKKIEQSKKSGSEDEESATESDASEKSEKKAKPSKSKPKPVKFKVEKVKPSKAGNKPAKKKKDPNEPKKNQSGYMIWLNENREKIKKPGMSVTDVAKKGGELWRELTDKSKWEELAREDKKRYQREMEEYRKSGGSVGAKSKSMTNGTSKSPKKSPIKAKSDEFVASDDSTDSEEEKKAKKQESDDQAEDDAESTPPASDKSDSD